MGGDGYIVSGVVIVLGIFWVVLLVVGVVVRLCFVNFVISLGIIEIFFC